MESKQGTLFELPEIITIPVKIVTGRRCRNCKHIYNHQYGKMKYCGKQNDIRTSYGHKKVKANDPCCDMFEPDK